MNVQKSAIRNARAGFVICVAATVLATLSFVNGSYILWAVNCVLLVIAAACVFVNYRIAGQL